MRARAGVTVAAMMMMGKPAPAHRLPFFLGSHLGELRLLDASID
jgi:hypothetical protein